MTEYSLHSEIKDWCKVSGDELEAEVENFIVDILREELLIEVQTGNFSAIKKKLARLLLDYQVRLVYPIAQAKWIVHVAKSGEFVRRRKSPKKGRFVDLFYELVHLPSLAKDGNLSLEVLLIEEEELRCHDDKGSWMRKRAKTVDRRLLNVIDRIVLKDSQDFLRFLPKELDACFTNKALAQKLEISTRLAQKITYCLRRMNAISIAGKNRNELLFQVSQNLSRAQRTHA